MKRLAAAAAVWLAAAGAIVACQREKTSTVAGPPLTVSPSDHLLEAQAGDGGPEFHGPPVTAVFVDMKTAGARIQIRRCEVLLVAVVLGKGSAAGHELTPEEYLVARGVGLLELHGEGIALLAAIRDERCLPADAGASVGSAVAVERIAIDGGAGLSWAQGNMRAHLDLEHQLGAAYAGRLEIAAAVPEHQHDSSWEYLGAISGGGTLVVDGREVHMGARSVVAIPPGRIHAFRPDPGARLMAIQIYYPAGPEQRFRALAEPSATDGRGGADSGMSETRGDAGGDGGRDGGRDAGRDAGRGARRGGL